MKNENEKQPNTHSQALSMKNENGKQPNTHSQVPTLRNTNIEVVQVWRAWYFSHVRSAKGREGVERP